MKSLIVATIVACMILMGAVAVYKYRQQEVQQEKQTSFDVKIVKILKGDEFDIQLEDGRRFYGYLSVKAVPEAEREVVRLLNTAQAARVLVKKTGANSEIDLILIINGKEVDLSDWLIFHKLVWEELHH